MDRAANNGFLPERTTLTDNVNANLSLWHRERALWRKESSCDASCACSTQPWFRSISSSEAELSKGLLCAAVECSELAVDDGSVVPKLYAPTCTRGECDHVDCLKKKLEQLRACKTEFADSDTLVRYRKYAKMERTRNDGSKYTEVPRARVSRLAPRSASGHRSCSPMHTPKYGSGLWVASLIPDGSSRWRGSGQKLVIP
eukprot:scaffold130272_cov36-Phaeocystis_antarctica.AAC.2